MTLATVSDVAVRLGRPISDPDEVQQVQAWIDDASAIVLNRIPDLPARMAAGAPTSAVVGAVVANVVIRKIQNPEGKVSEDIDDYRYRLNENARRGELFLTDDEWRLLLPGERDGAWTITPGGPRRRAGQWVHPDVWVPLP